MLWNRSHIEEGMTVRSSDGDKLGKVIAIGEQSFEIEKGFFILKDYVIPYADIQDVRDGECFLRYGKEQLQGREADFEEARDLPQEPHATSAAGVTPLASGMPRENAAGLGSEAEVTRVPLARERLDVTKEDHESGEVHIYKTVETETETIEVPVRRERVEVERVKGTGVTANADGAFREEEIRIPLHAEEVRVNKEVVTDEEVRVTKTPFEERKKVSGQVRREHAEIRADDEAEDTSKRRGWMPGDDEPTRY